MVVQVAQAHQVGQVHLAVRGHRQVQGVRAEIPAPETLRESQGKYLPLETQRLRPKETAETQ